MKKNVGVVDMVIRVVLAAVAAVSYFGGYVPGRKGLVVLALGAILLITGLIGFCPLYTIFGISTKKQ